MLLLALWLLVALATAAEPASAPAPAAAPLVPLTLAQAIDEALEHNSELRGARVIRDRAELALVQARSGAVEPVVRTSVDAGASRTPTNAAVDGIERLISRSAGFAASIDQPLPSGGAVGLTWQESWSTTNSANVISASTVTDRASLSVRQPVLGGLGAPLRIVRTAVLARDAAALQLRSQIEQLVLAVSAAYWRLVSARQTRELAQRSEEIAGQSLRDIEERFAEGFAGSGDVLQVQRALGTARLAALVAASEVEAADADLRRVLGRDVGGPAALDPVDLPELPDVTALSADEVFASARDNNAGWLLEQLELEQAELGARDARLGALPNLDLVGSVGTSGLGAEPGAARRGLVSGENSDYSIGLSLSVPLPGGTLRGAWTDAALAREAARIARDAALQDLALRVQRGVRDVERDRSRVVVAADTVRVAKAALEADQELLREGSGSTRNVVISLEALDAAQAAELQARIDLQASLLELRRVAGVLLEGE